jgi:hypothetical protein
MRPRPQRGGRARGGQGGLVARAGVVACLVASPREGAPEADGALRAAIAAAAACPQVDTVRSRAALVRPCCSDYAPPHTSCISCPGLQAALRFLPECLRRSRRLDHRGNTGGGGGEARESEEPEGMQKAREGMWCRRQPR